MVFIEMKDVVRVYRTGTLEVQALRGLDLELNEQDIVSVIGPSGSGKTTLLNIIGGLDTPTAGTAKVGKYDINLMTPKELVLYRRSVVGHVFQNFNLIPTLNAAENVELSMIAAGVKGGDRKKRIHELLDIVGLSDRAKHKPAELSGGEQQRVAIASALSNDPPILLADEPTGELDTENAQMVMEFFLKINKELGKTIIIVTHDSRMARQTDRIFRIEDGRIIASYLPAQMDELPTGTAVSYADQLQVRMEDLQKQIQANEKLYKKEKLPTEEFIKEHSRLTNALQSLKDEYHRTGH
ncbi:MAG: ABC transporter ATP-binding protein [Candidatus Ranarchaeia archaeon]|jgi:putative ABC transport system ATP-binding protein